MSIGSFNWVDYVVLALFIFSTVLGLMRGFVKEVIALMTWLAAFVIAGMFAGPVARYFESSSESIQASAEPASLFSICLSFIVIFLVVLIIGKLINYIFSRAADMGGVSLMNPLLGAVFGFARGFLLVILMMFLIDFTTIAEADTWKDSYFVNVCRPTVEWVEQQVEPHFQDLKSKMAQTIHNVDTAYL